MVVAEQVQGRMDCEERKYTFGRMSVFRRLLHGLFGGDDDIAEQNGVVSGVDVACRGACVKLVFLPHGEREHVGGLVLSPVFEIERVDFLIAHKADGYLRRTGKRLLAERFRHGLPDERADGGRDAYGLLTVLKINGVLHLPCSFLAMRYFSLFVRFSRSYFS